MRHICLVIEHSTTISDCIAFFFFFILNYIGSHGIHILFENNPLQFPIISAESLSPLTYQGSSVIIQRSHKGENVLTLQIVKGECFILQDAPWGQVFTNLQCVLNFTGDKDAKESTLSFRTYKIFSLIFGLASKIISTFGFIFRTGNQNKPLLKKKKIPKRRQC